MLAGEVVVAEGGAVLSILMGDVSIVAAEEEFDDEPGSILSKRESSRLRRLPPLVPEGRR
jgi:hypothetical protein